MFGREFAESKPDLVHFREDLHVSHCVHSDDSRIFRVLLRFHKLPQTYFLQAELARTFITNLASADRSDDQMKYNQLSIEQSFSTLTFSPSTHLGTEAPIFLLFPEQHALVRNR